MLKSNTPRVENGLVCSVNISRLSINVLIRFLDACFLSTEVHAT